MPTTRPRISVTMTPELYRVVERLAKASGQTMSRIVGDFLAVAEGPMSRAVRVLERAAEAEYQAKNEVRASLGNAERLMLPAILEGLKQLELELTAAGIGADELAEASVRGRSVATDGRARRGLPPVPVTRGVGTPKTAGKPQKRSLRRA